MYFIVFWREENPIMFLIGVTGPEAGGCVSCYRSHIRLVHVRGSSKLAVSLMTSSSSPDGEDALLFFRTE